MLIVCRLIFNAAISVLFQLRMRIRMLNSKTIQKYNTKRFFSLLLQTGQTLMFLSKDQCVVFSMKGPADLFKCACAVPLAQRDLVKTINEAQFYDKIC